MIHPLVIAWVLPQQDHYFAGIGDALVGAFYGRVDLLHQLELGLQRFLVCSRIVPCRVNGCSWAGTRLGDSFMCSPAFKGLRFLHFSERRTGLRCDSHVWSGSPDGVECLLIQWQRPAGCDALTGQVVEAHGGPPVGDVADRGDTVGEGGDPASGTGEDVAALLLERAAGEVSAPLEVAEDLRNAVVGPGDAVGARGWSR